MNEKQKMQFEANQRDLMLDDTKAWWKGMRVDLLTTDGTKTLAMFDLDTRRPVAAKIALWCIKNHYRCSQVDLNTMRVNI